MTKQGNLWTDLEDSVILDLTGKGLKASEIAESLLGRSTGAIRARRAKLGASVFFKQEWTDEKMDGLAEGRRRGLSSQELAAQFGVGESTINRQLKKLRDPVEQARRGRKVIVPASGADGLRYGHQGRTLLHLLDLKRAGHSPRFTELRIIAERPAYMITHRPVDRSPCGSQAAMCEEA
jgi:biotin operon repressor